MGKSWKKIITLTDDKDIAEVVPQCMAAIKAGEEAIETLRCVFYLENDPCIYMLPALDFVDFRPERKIISLSTYQMVG